MLSLGFSLLWNAIFTTYKDVDVVIKRIFNLFLFITSGPFRICMVCHVAGTE